MFEDPIQLNLRMANGNIEEYITVVSRVTMMPPSFSFLNKFLSWQSNFLLLMIYLLHLLYYFEVVF